MTSPRFESRWLSRCMQPAPPPAGIAPPSLLPSPLPPPLPRPHSTPSTPHAVEREGRRPSRAVQTCWQAGWGDGELELFCALMQSPDFQGQALEMTRKRAMNAFSDSFFGATWASIRFCTSSHNEKSNGFRSGEYVGKGIGWIFRLALASFAL